MDTAWQEVNLENKLAHGPSVCARHCLLAGKDESNLWHLHWTWQNRRLQLHLVNVCKLILCKYICCVWWWNAFAEVKLFESCQAKTFLLNCLSVDVFYLLISPLRILHAWSSSFVQQMSLSLHLFLFLLNCYDFCAFAWTYNLMKRDSFWPISYILGSMLHTRHPLSVFICFSNSSSFLQ